jgi:hypothetical protein
MNDHRRWCSDEKAFLIGFAVGSVSVMVVSMFGIIGFPA